MVDIKNTFTIILLLITSIMTELVVIRVSVLMTTEPLKFPVLERHICSICVVLDIFRRITVYVDFIVTGWFIGIYVVTCIPNFDMKYSFFQDQSPHSLLHHPERSQRLHV